MFLVSGQGTRFKQSGCHAGLKTIRDTSRCAQPAQARRGLCGDHFSPLLFSPDWNACQYPRAARASRFLSAITGVMLGVPVALPHFLNEGRIDGVAFDGQRVVGNRSDRFRRRSEGTLPCLWEAPALLGTSRGPGHASIPKASPRGSSSARRDGSACGVSARLQMGCSLDTSYSRALHRTENLVRKFAAPVWRKALAR